MSPIVSAKGKVQADYLSDIEKLTIEEQNSISEDQKHTSNVAKVH